MNNTLPLVLRALRPVCVLTPQDRPSQRCLTPEASSRPETRVCTAPRDSAEQTYMKSTTHQHVHILKGQISNFVQFCIMYFWCVQLGPKETHNAFSCAVRLFCSRATAPCVIAGLDTDAAKPGPPVALTIYKHTNQGELLHLSALYSTHNSVQTLLMKHLKQCSATKALKALPFAQDTVAFVTHHVERFEDVMHELLGRRIGDDGF